MIDIHEEYNNKKFTRSSFKCDCKVNCFIIKYAIIQIFIDKNERVGKKLSLHYNYVLANWVSLIY